MNKSIYWLNSSNTVLVLTVPIYWEWEEMHAWITSLSEQLDESESPITVVIDFQKSTYLPQNIISNVQASQFASHKMINTLILTNLSQTHQSALNMLCRLYPENTKRWLLSDRLEDVIASVS